MAENKAHIIIIDGASGTGKKTLCFELALVLLYNQQKTALVLSDDSPLRQTLELRKARFPELPLPTVLSRKDFSEKPAIITLSSFRHQPLMNLPPAQKLLSHCSPKIKSVLQIKQDVMYINNLWELKKKIASGYSRSLNWVVCENNLTDKNADAPSAELFQAAKMYGFRLCPPLNRRKAYLTNNRGLSAQDKTATPLKDSLTYDDICAKREIIKLAEFIFS